MNAKLIAQAIANSQATRKEMKLLNKKQIQEFIKNIGTETYCDGCGAGPIKIGQRCPKCKVLIECEP